MGWTIRDAVAFLVPRMTSEEVRALVIAARIPPVAMRRPAGKGRPAFEYDESLIMRAHAVIMALLAER